MAGTVSRSGGTLNRRAFAHVLHVAAKRALVDRAVIVAAERHAGMFEFINGGRGLAHHIFDRVLVAEPVRPLDGVEHVPRPMVGRIVAERCGDSALCCNGVAARRKNLGNARGFQAGFGDAHRRAQAGTAGTHDDRVVRMIDNLIGLSHVRLR